MLRARFAAGVLAVLLVLALGGCALVDRNDERRGRGDAPVGQQDDSPAEVIVSPDNFPNISHKCDGHGHRVYVTTRDDAGGVQLEVVDDPSCG